VIAGLWVIGAGISAVRDTSIPSLTRSCEELRGFVIEGTNTPLGDADVSDCKVVWGTKRLTLLEWTIGPPFALLIIGVVLAWVIQGFKAA
jgi:hypothetical protein